MTLLGQIFAYASGILLVISIVMGGFIYSYKSEIKSLTFDILTKDLNNRTLEKSLDKQNKAIENQRVDYEVKIQWYKDNPVTIEKIKTVYVTKYKEKKIYITPDSNETEIAEVNKKLKDYYAIDNILSNVRINGI